jgi:hypothetical protein
MEAPGNGKVFITMTTRQHHLLIHIIESGLKDGTLGADYTKKLLRTIKFQRRQKRTNAI